MAEGGGNAVIEVESDLRKVIKDLEAIADAQNKVGKGFGDAGKEIGKSIDDAAGRTGRGVRVMGTAARGVLNNLINDFKALGSVASLSAGLKLSSQFSNNVRETLSLTDAIRKMGNTFGVATADFGKFQSKLTKGLGELGLNSEVAVRAMEGLVDTPVRGQAAVEQYAKTAGKLASVTRQEGKEGEIARGIANVLTAQGKDPNDLRAAQGVGEDLRKAFKVTGKSPQEILGGMERLFKSMNVDDRKRFQGGGATNLAAAAQVAGKGATDFLEKYLSMSNIERMGLDEMGFKGILGPGGLDVDKFKKAAEGVFKLIPEDRQKAAEIVTQGDAEAAKGFIALYESLDRVNSAQEELRRTTGNLAEDFRNSAGPVEAFQRNVNRVKGILSEGVGGITQGAADLLSKASESDMGAAAVSGGAAIGAALLTGGGLRGLAGGLMGRAKAEGISKLTGKEVQDVYVVNASEISAGGVAGGLAGGVGKVAGLAGKAGGLGLAAAGGAMLGGIVNEHLISKTQGTTSEGFEGNAIERLIFKLDKLIGGEASKQIEVGLKVSQAPKNLNVTQSRTRGAAQGRSSFKGGN